MAIVLESQVTTAPGGSATTIVINAPTGVQAGDVLVAIINGVVTSGSLSVTASGWTVAAEIFANLACLSVLTRVAGGSEPSSYTFTYSQSASTRRGAIQRFSGVDNTTPVNGTPTTNSGTSATLTGTSITTTIDNAFVLLYGAWSANDTNFTPSELTSRFNINRLGGAGDIQATAGSTGNKTASITSGQWRAALMALAPQSAPPNQPPSVSLVTADNATFTTQAQLDFIGTDDDNDSITYELHLADNELFSDGTTVTTEQTGTGTVVHPNPAGGTTWEGYIQVDDRVMTSFVAAGGILDSVDFYFGPHETLPQDTDGYYLARLYEAAGTPVHPVPDTWQPSTAYSVGAIVRPTSIANANVHFVYRCKTSGTSGANEPAWPGNGVAWKTVADGTEVNDGTVVWEALAGMHPANPADPADTPTPGWIAQSEVYYYAPGQADNSWKTLAFTGSNRVRLEAGKHYVIGLDWRPTNTTNTNTIAIQTVDFASAVLNGNVYLDGANTNNNGARIIGDAAVRVREVLSSNTYASNADGGFTNQTTPADTDPFNSGDTIRYTSGTLAQAIYFWKVRGKDPSGTNSFGSFTAVRRFTITGAGGNTYDVSVSLGKVGYVSDGANADMVDATSIAIALYVTGNSEAVMELPVSITRALAILTSTGSGEIYNEAITLLLSKFVDGISVLDISGGLALGEGKQISASGNIGIDAALSLAIARVLAAAMGVDLFPNITLQHSEQVTETVNASIQVQFALPIAKTIDVVAGLRYETAVSLGMQLAAAIASNNIPANTETPVARIIVSSQNRNTTIEINQRTIIVRPSGRTGSSQ